MSLWSHQTLSKSVRGRSARMLFLCRIVLAVCGMAFWIASGLLIFLVKPEMWVVGYSLDRTLDFMELDLELVPELPTSQTHRKGLTDRSMPLDPPIALSSGLRIHCSPADLSFFVFDEQFAHSLVISAELDDMNITEFGGYCPETDRSEFSAFPRVIHTTQSSERVDLNSPGFAFHWAIMNPWHHFVAWSDETLHDFVEMCVPSLLDVYESAPLDVMRYDLARYLLLLVFGGVWADWDVMPLREIDDW
ncbi:hypothetical protein HDU93_006422, partial [Gonapodya sp. JEL0774]